MAMPSCSQVAQVAAVQNVLPAVPRWRLQHGFVPRPSRLAIELHHSFSDEMRRLRTIWCARPAMTSRRSSISESTAVRICRTASPVGFRLDLVAGGESGEDDGQVRIDGFALMMVDRPGLQGHARPSGSPFQRCTAGGRRADELVCLVNEVGSVALAPDQSTGLGLQVAADALGRHR